MSESVISADTIGTFKNRLDSSYPPEILYDCKSDIAKLAIGVTRPEDTRPTRSHAHRCSRLTRQHGGEQSGLVTLIFDLLTLKVVSDSPSHV